MKTAIENIAHAAGVPVDRVRCETCEWAERTSKKSYVCQYWHGGHIMPKDAYCSFWVDGGEQDD